MMPGLIQEEDDRPVEMKPKLDVLDFWSIVKPELPGMRGLCSQVTAFIDEPSLPQRLGALIGAGIEGIVFVGVPRTMADGEGPVSRRPTPCRSISSWWQPRRDPIPTREGEEGRLNFKCDQGATFAQTQLLYSDAIVGFLTEFAERTTTGRRSCCRSASYRRSRRGSVSSTGSSKTRATPPSLTSRRSSRRWPTPNRRNSAS